MCIFHTCLHIMLFYTPSQIHNPSNINALKIVNQISLPLIFSLRSEYSSSDMYLYISGTGNSRLLLSRNHPSEVRYSPDIFWNMHCTLECRIPGLCEVQIPATPEPVRIQLPSGRNFCRKIFPPDTFRQSEVPE